MEKQISIFQFFLLIFTLFILVQIVSPIPTSAEPLLEEGKIVENEKLHSGDNGVFKEEINLKERNDTGERFLEKEAKSEEGLEAEEEPLEEETATEEDSETEEELLEEEVATEEGSQTEEELLEEETAAEEDSQTEEELLEEETAAEEDSKTEEELLEEEIAIEEDSKTEEELLEEETATEEDSETEEELLEEERAAEEGSETEEELLEGGIAVEEGSETEEELLEEETATEEDSEIEEEASENEEEISHQNTDKSLEQTQFKTVTPFSNSSTGYFEVNVNNLTVYDNRGNGPLKPIGNLKKGEVYPIFSDYGNWWRVQFGDIYGYVKKSDTVSGKKTDIKNWNESYDNTEHKYTANQNVTVYDNTSGKLVPFGELNKETVFPIASDYGSWWRVVYLDRVGYVRKDEGNVQYADFQNYFKADKNLPIYDNRGNGPLKQVGEIEKGQAYERVNDYGSWHRIQFGDIYGYVEKFGTSPDNGRSINNENKTYTDTKHKYKATQDVTVYDNSSGSLEPIGKLSKGTVFPIATDYTNWWRIVFADRVGYVQKNEGNLQHANFNNYFRADQTTAIYDNRGSGPLKKVGEVIEGQEYSIVSDYGSWHRIQFGDIHGYVRKFDTSPSTGRSIQNKNNYTKISRDIKSLRRVTIYDNTSGTLVPFGNLEKGSILPIASDYGSWWRVILADRIGYVRKDEVQAEFKKGDEFFRVHRNNLPIYDNRGSGSLKKVGSLQKNQVFSIVSDYGNWWRVQFGDIYGYVRKSDTGYATGTEINNLNNSYTNSDRKLTPKKQVDVYDNSSGKLVSMGKIDKDINYVIASDYGNWWRVLYLDRIGYVLKADVNITGGAVKTPYNVTLSEALKMQMNASAQTDSPYAYVSKAYISNNRVTASALNVRSGPAAGNKTVGQLSNGTKVTILGEYNGWYQISFNHRQWVNASEKDVLHYLDPTNFVNDARQQFQFLDLSKISDASITDLNNYLSGKGTLSSQGKAFRDAGKAHGINDVYLLSHAILETGNGGSTLAKGVMYNGVKVYNMYGVGAFDNCAIECGAKRAYEEGWTTPYKAIVGGASFIGNSYVKAGQNTLYKMRWNPEGMERHGYATHQYATDIGWAQKQVSTMYNLYQALKLDNLQLDIPEYKS
ncbi:SH3 domain-containing protein [Oceanobacillus aidingensis]|uniref:SH3 domain-containing protein n=1 Tax=Oceanobacillus aidingensis TaxID=645964 RepID=A0ABV9JUK3_9BACI